MKKRRHEEEDLQMAVVQWFDLQYPKLSQFFFHVASGGSRSFKTDRQGRRFSLEAMRFKKMGVRKGVPDMFLAVPVGRHHGLFLEFKSSIGALTKEQRTFMDQAAGWRYAVEVVRSFDEARVFINVYLKVRYMETRTQ